MRHPGGPGHNLWLHGLTGTRAHNIWRGMLDRCSNPKTKTYQRYGARGIAVCERWHAFTNFIEDMGHCPSVDHSIDRINSAGNYEPGNCRWATRVEQANNQRTNRIVEYRGEPCRLGNLAVLVGISRRNLQQRYQRGDRGAALVRPLNDRWSP